MNARRYSPPHKMGRKTVRTIWIVDAQGAAYSSNDVNTVAQALAWIAKRPHLVRPTVYIETRLPWKMASRQPTSSSGRRGGDGR